MFLYSDPTKKSDDSSDDKAPDKSDHEVILEEERS